MEEKYTKPVRHFDILLISDEVEEGFDTAYEWWTKTERICRGNGREAMRKVSAITDKDVMKRVREQNAELFSGAKLPVAVPWSPCGSECPDLDPKRCKVSGKLYFLLAAKPMLGAICAYYTTSKHTAIEMSSSLYQISELTGGRLKYMPLQMSLRPGKTRYTDAKGEKRTGTAFFVHLEYHPQEATKLLPELMRQSLLVERARAGQAKEVKLIGAGAVHEVMDAEVDELPEAEMADVINAEFTDVPQTQQPVAAAPTPATQKEADESEKAFEAAVTALNLNKAQRDMTLAKFSGDFASSAAFLLKLREYTGKLKADSKQALKWLTEGIQNPDGLWKVLEAKLAAPPKPPAAEKPKETKTEKKPEPKTEPTPEPPASDEPPLPEPPPDTGKAKGNWEDF